MTKRDATLKSKSQHKRSIFCFEPNPRARKLIAKELSKERRRKPFGALARVLNTCIIQALGSKYADVMQQFEEAV